MLTFERPFLLPLLVLAPLCVLLGPRWRALHFGPRFPIATAGHAPFSGTPLVRRAGRRIGQCLFALGLSLVALAAAGPTLVGHRMLYLTRGNEILFAVDVSPSMAARDFAPTRLDAAKAIIGEFLNSRRNETVGLVAFGSEAALVCPPTLDYAALKKRLADLAPGMLGDGTALGSGIGLALAHASAKGAPSRFLVLLTDGESNAGTLAPGTAAELAARRGVAVFVVGVGSEGDVPINYVDPETGKRSEGSYRSGFDQSALEALARSGGGRYFAAGNAAALAAAFSALGEESLSLAVTRSVSTERPLAQPALAFALAVLVLARLLALATGGDFL